MNLPDNIFVPLLFFINIYIVIDFLIVRGFVSLKKQGNSQFNSKLSQFSIVVAARNEEKNIASLLDSLLAQDYPKEAFEILVVDDASEDNTFAILEKYAQKNNIYVFKNNAFGKKSALQKAWKHSQNEYIIQIDADCSVKNNYLNSINTYLLENKELKLLLAPVLLQYKLSDFWSSIQALEFSSLMVSTAGFTYYGIPIMSNGANLIYPKNILNELDKNLEKRTPSGDDIFLLQAVKVKWGSRKIHYLKSQEAVVYTKANESLKDFWQQRIRWASKAKYFKDKWALFIGSFIFLINISILFSFTLSLFYPTKWIIFALFFCAKFLSDFIVLVPFLFFHKNKRLLIYYPILAILYIFYVSFVGVLAPFSYFKWKDRIYH